MEAPPRAGWTGRQAVELYVRTYTTMLQSSGDIKIDSLVHAHLSMASVLHPLAGEPQVDMGALLYAVPRLPSAIARGRRVLMGQSPQGFRAVFGTDILSWQAVKAPARRRRWYHSGDTLAVLIASPSDIDDLVPTLVAYQIEWNKLHRLLQDVALNDAAARTASGATEGDWEPLHRVFGRAADADGDAKRPSVKAANSGAPQHTGLYSGARRWSSLLPAPPRLPPRRAESETANGIRHIPARGTGVDSAAQVFKISELDPAAIDPRVGPVDEKKLRASAACIVNVDYPLGLAAYHILRQVAEHSAWVAGVYILGKAATLNAEVGDVMIPNAVHNEHSGNTYWLDNSIAAADVQPNLVYGSALDNQRAVAVRGTFLQNRDYLDMYYQGRYTVVEVEAGPYLP